MWSRWITPSTRKTEEKIDGLCQKGRAVQQAEACVKKRKKMKPVSRIVGNLQVRMERKEGGINR